MMELLMWLQHHWVVPVMIVFLLILVHHLLAGAQGPDRAAWPHPARRRSLRSLRSANQN
jgi:hypothetical protein